MKKIITKSVITMLVVMLSYLNVFSQEKKIYKGEIPAPVKTDESVLRERQNQPPVSKEIIDFQNRMKAAKESENRDEIIRLQSESYRITGTHTAVPQQLEVTKLTTEETDNIVMNNITNSSDKVIYGMATCTEQSGNNIGRIWSIYSYFPAYSPHYPDGIGIKYSDDNGNTWNNYGIYSFGGSQIVGDDAQIDAELVINTSNEKYLWITFATYPNINTIHSRIGVFIVNLNTGVHSNSVLNWPSGPIVKYKTPRIVSDNAAYSNSAYIYIVASFDSSFSSNDPARQGEKVAICYNPYTTSPSITYRTSSFMRTVNNGYHGLGDYFNCDIAYYRNGGQDSILLVETGLQSYSSIVLGSASIFSFVTSNTFLTYIGAINTNSNIRWRGFVASNGAYNNLMISVINQFSATDNDIEYYHSTNGSAGWSQGFIDYTSSNANTDPDITGQRNVAGEFAVAFANIYLSKILYYQTDSYNWSSVALNNYSHLVNGRKPKAGIKLNSGSENCFAIWSDTTRHGLWSSAGCTGPVQTYAKLNLSAAIEGLHIPVSNTLTPDTIRVYLRNSFVPYSIVDSSVNILSNILLNEFIFSNVSYNTPCYIQIRHRNALESWSSGTITFSTYEKNYSFWPQANTFGNNSKKVFDNGIITIYGFYSGDVNQDGAIDLADVLQIYNAANSFTTGYVVPDLTGNDAVDLSDVIMAYNNSVGFVSVVKP